jgi:protein gp37
MADSTKIEWTDATWNPVTGCALESEGCRHCYAARLAATRLRHHPSRAGLARLNAAGEAKFTGEVRFNEQWLAQPLRWQKPRRVFVVAHGDLFYEKVPDAWIDRVFAVMALCPQHTFQVLTKRPPRARDYLDEDGPTFDRVYMAMIELREQGGYPSIREQCAKHGIAWTKPTCREDWWPLRNVWLGTSVEDRQTMLDRGAALKECPAALRFWSFEPMLGAPGHIPLDIMPDWMICGGESGPNARPMHPDWARSLRDQCAAAGVPLFFKQWGAWAPTLCPSSDGPTHWVFQSGQSRQIENADYWPIDGLPMRRVGKTAAGRLLDGVLHDAMPEVR